jgi:hypothetical protein
VFCAQLNEVTQQPDERRKVIVLLLFSRAVDPFADALNPHVAIVHFAERGLHARDILRVILERSVPALVKKLERVAQTFRSDAHVV